MQRSEDWGTRAWNVSALGIGRMGSADLTAKRLRPESLATIHAQLLSGINFLTLRRRYGLCQRGTLSVGR